MDKIRLKNTILNLNKPILNVNSPMLNLSKPIVNLKNILNLKTSILNLIPFGVLPVGLYANQSFLQMAVKKISISI